MAKTAEIDCGGLVRTELYVFPASGILSQFHDLFVHLYDYFSFIAL